MGLYMEIFERTQALIGRENLNILKESTIVLFGLGGVGGFVFEALIRSGVGKIVIVDYDKVNPSNINRQIIATTSNIGKFKTDEFIIRAKEINIDAKVIDYKKKIISLEDLSFLDGYNIDYIVDAIDTFEGKISIIKYALANRIKIISSMGTGNKVNPGLFEITDIFKTSMCPLAKKIRNRLRKENINSLKVIYSKEEPVKHGFDFIASIAFVPSTAGLLIASEVIRDLCGL